MNCESCAMVMEKPEHHGGMRKSNKYCVNCTHEDGSLKERQFVRNGWLQSLMNEGKTKKEAEALVDAAMVKMSAWQ